MTDIQEHTVSLVIPTWNQKELLSECLTSVVNVERRVRTEIIVVDDASTDNTASYLREQFPGVTVIENRMNEGYARSVNKGVALSQGDMIFLLNNDTRLEDNPIDTLVSFLADNRDAGAVAPLLYFPDGNLQVSCRRFPTPAAILLEKLGIQGVGPFRRWKLTLEEHGKGGPVMQPMASALLIRRECWDMVGPLDEEFPIFFNDVDWCYRLYRNTSYTIALCTDARVIHHVGASVNRLGYRKKIEFYRGLLKFYRKHLLFSQPGALSRRN
jgi:GT2 family glycosyltransferase